MCGIYYTSLEVDLSRAKLNDLVEDFVKLQLGYGEKEFAVNSDAGLVYDPDLTDNLDKDLSELGLFSCCDLSGVSANVFVGIKQNSFVTIVDEEDEDTFVNVVVNIQEAYVIVLSSLYLLLTYLDSKLADKPIKGFEDGQAPNIPRKSKKTLPIHSNGVNNGVNSTNGKHQLDGQVPSGKKRARSDDAGPPLQKQKTKADDDDIVVIDDDAGTGAIEILD